MEQWAAETHNLSKLYYQRKRTRAANACPLLFTAKITNHKQKIIHFDTKAQNVRKCATIGIFLLFFIGLAMFCKIPVGYSTPALFMPIIIFGYIYGGIFTATEAGASVVLYGIVFYFVKRFMNKNNVDAGFLKMTVDAAIGITTICILIGFSNCSGRVISTIDIAEPIEIFVTAHIFTAFGFLVFANIMFLICSMLIDINAAILLAMPLLPTSTAMGIDPIHFGTIILV